MENILRPIYQERASNPSTSGILLIEKRTHLELDTNTFDYILLVITNEYSKEQFVKHYQYEDNKIALYIISINLLKEWILLSSNRKVFDWLYYGKIIFDRNDFLHNLITEIKDFPFHERKLKIGIEYAKLIKRYTEGKKLYEGQQYMDAYSYIVHALHHLGRLALIEKGIHPEIALWNQVKQIEPEIVKLYEELVNSHEPLKKRLELLFLASDFFIHSRANIGAAHLIEILNEKENWSIQEIIEQEELKLYSIDIYTFLEFLVEKAIIKIDLIETKGKSVHHRYYRVVDGV
ncbi:nucleotidyltransferase-like protein [Bacillus kwashiorkori]|uniref:nucleotidyltransferase-like protein n=1 Tax=Bacillus kwashiorkori TaxID=1522318 RepID=UPI000780EDA8|nr:nucleotidyltransferase-like protein [Bacillus kwashiorkori]